MKKGLTLIEIILAIAIGLLIFQMLFSSNLLFTKIYQDSIAVSSSEVDQANSLLYLYKNISNAHTDYSNNYQGRLNRGYFVFEDVRGDLNTFYLYAKDDYADFSQNYFNKQQYYLMHFKGILLEETYGEGHKVLDKIAIKDTDWLMSYAMDVVTVQFHLGGRELNYQVRVKN